MSKRKKTISIISLCLLACIAVGAFVMAKRGRLDSSKHLRILPSGMEYSVGTTVAVGHFKYIDDEEFFVDDWDGHYDLQYLDGWDARSVWKTGVMDYEEYLGFCNSAKPCGYVQTYHDPSKHYIVYGKRGTSNFFQARLAAVTYSETTAEMYLLEKNIPSRSDQSGKVYIIVVPTTENVNYIDIHDLYYTVDEYDWVKENMDFICAEKPVIYLYPEEKTDVTVTLGNPEYITHSYPKYDSPWHVTALPDGTLTDMKTGRELYSLYYENASPVPLSATEEGFVVRGENAAAFLEEKLAVLGLSEKEAEEFIIYWLPRLEMNEWNYIRFASKAEIDAEMPLEIAPEPDSVIRVLMLWKALDAPIAVREQTIDTPARTGFTAVEWGGAEIH